MLSEMLQITAAQFVDFHSEIRYSTEFKDQKSRQCARGIFPPTFFFRIVQIDTLATKAGILLRGTRMLWFRIRLENSSSETRTLHSHLRWSPHGTCLAHVGRGVSARCAAAFAPPRINAVQRVPRATLEPPTRLALVAAVRHHPAA